MLCFAGTDCRHFDNFTGILQSYSCVNRAQSHKYSTQCLSINLIVQLFSFFSYRNMSIRHGVTLVSNSQSSPTADLFIDSNLQKLGNLDTRLGYLPTMNAATEVGGYVLCEQNAVLPMTDSSDHKESSNGGYIENTNKICNSSQYGHESSINYWKSPFDDESEDLVPLDEVLCLDGHRHSEGLFMAYFGDEGEAGSSDYIINPTDSHHTVYNNKDGYYAT